MSDSQSIIEASSVATSAAAKATVGGAGASLLGKVTGLDPVTAIGLIIGVGGLLISVLSFFINVYYKWRENKRADEIHRLKLKELRGQCNVKD
ncbi:phage holin family protein [Acinetobacter larvae]|uniref:Lysis protein n=1 Tax=Acinetobacter larvae TaxID=1789224 RepID=A0A1B2LX94_9GAMM|nr:holin [Acinetobacter larvae]AOA57582.1 hypothetical protein BFG52_03910 [Acinetobacter larvae]